jgi:hypothetical protein
MSPVSRVRCTVMQMDIFHQQLLMGVTILPSSPMLFVLLCDRAASFAAVLFPPPSPHVYGSVPSCSVRQGPRITRDGTGWARKETRGQLHVALDTIFAAKRLDLASTSSGQ